mmetsp:Transcript_8599/g.18554  ORF Transcript_8599/g.18554 Transcript_8599/m.18554 type:complete len:885 (+) Transcript_8599:133-2787(+)
MTWSCFYCTFDNDDESTTQCSLCGMPGNRTSQKAETAGLDGKGRTTNTAVDLTEAETTVPSSKTKGLDGNQKSPQQQPNGSSSSSSTIDLTSTNTNAITSSRKRKKPSSSGSDGGDNNNDYSNGNGGKLKSSRNRTDFPNINTSLGRRKPPKPPKLNQRQSTISFSSVSDSSSVSPFSHGHVFAHKVRPKEATSKNNYELDMQRVLEKVFGLEGLRPNLQPDAIQCAMQRTSQMVVMATGGGKSLCYQLPACLLGGVTIVISPLLALMKDQTEALQQKGIPAAGINSSQTEKENKAILERLVPALYPKSLGSSSSNSKKNTVENNNNNNAVVASTQPAVLLYVTPESIQTERMRAVLKTLHKENRLGLFAVDEAHCLSTWGHDFRSSYRKLNYLRTTYPETPCIALTATATPKVIHDITNELRLHKCPLHIGSFDRPNIFYKVKYKDALENPLEELVKSIKSRHKESNTGGKTGDENHKNDAAKSDCSGIVYVHKRDDTFMIARAISKAGITASAYHAGLKKADRIAVQDGWSSGKIQVAVATVAFGMGIDRHCVRYVYHWNLPKTIEGFYQEAGRAGRDGLPSLSTVFYSPEDVIKYKYLVRMQGSKRKGGEAEERKAEKNIEQKLEQLEEMQEYCTQMKCRRNILIKHFGGKPVNCSKTCDVCRNPKKVERSMHASTAIKDVRKQQKGFAGRGKKSGGKDKQPWNGQWGRPHGDFGDEDAIANDWGDNCLMAGDLRITGPLGTESEDYAPSFSSDRLPRKGFAKASDILSKYEAMEGRYGANSRDDPPRSKSTSINIPEHLKASLRAASDFTTANNVLSKKKVTKPLMSSDHASNAKQIEERLAKLKAQREERLKSFQAKTRSKPPPPPPAPLSFGSRKKRK